MCQWAGFDGEVLGDSRDGQEIDLTIDYRPKRGVLRNFWLRRFAWAMTALQRRKPPDERALDCTHLDGSAIRDADMEAVRDAVWKHMVIEPWQRGDVVAIDNHSTSHGRLPYRGPRQIAVCWA